MYKYICKEIFAIILFLVGLAFVIFAFHKLYVHYYNVFVIAVLYMLGTGFVNISNLLFENIK